MIESLGPLEGKYEIIEAIGEGGMGTVFKVRHKILDEIRVVKMMRSHLVAEEESKERFFREARIAAKARHRNIAHIFDFSVDEGVAFLIMEYIDGVTLQQALANHGAMSIPLTLEISQQSLHALAFVHRMGIIHRDISPDNLMLTSDSDGNPRVKLIDLGLAKFTEADSGLTKEGFFLGKLRYASPEQFQTLQGVELGAWSDVYSFGLVMYEMLTGHYPIKGRNLAEMMVGHVSEPPMPFSDSDPDGRIPDQLRAIVFRALEKKSSDRFADGRDFREQVLVVQHAFPCGPAEKEEANLARQSTPAEPETAGGRTSDKDRLARAFGADESSAGRGTAETRAFEDSSGAAAGTSAASGERGSGTGRVGSRGDRTQSTPQTKSPLDPTILRQTPPPIEVGSDEIRAGEAVEKQEGRHAPPPVKKPPREEKPTKLIPAPSTGRKPDPPTIPFRRQKVVEEEGPRKPRSSARVEPKPAFFSRRRVIGAVAALAVLVLVAGLLLRWIPVPFLGAGPMDPSARSPQGPLSSMPSPGPGSSRFRIARERPSTSVVPTTRPSSPH